MKRLLLAVPLFFPLSLQALEVTLSGEAAKAIPAVFADMGFQKKLADKRAACEPKNENILVGDGATDLNGDKYIQFLFTLWCKDKSVVYLPAYFNLRTGKVSY